MSFLAHTMILESSYVRLASLFQLAEVIWQQRSDLRAAFPLHENPSMLPDYWYWLTWFGTRDNYCDRAAEVRALMSPIPDGALIGRVVGEDTTPEQFITGGLVNWRRVRQSLTEGGFDFMNGGRVLDFGAGCGRILRHFALDVGHSEFFGADVDEDATEWCSSNLEFAQCFRLPFSPPSLFGDGFFDAVYAYSVFTHLSEASQHEWLKDLHRISRTGAVLVLTTQGRRAVDIILGGKHQWAFPSSEVLLPRVDELERRGLAFFPYRRLDSSFPRNQEHFDAWNLKEYGSMLVLESYIRKHWGDLFEIVAFHEAPDQWQDYTILRRR